MSEPDLNDALVQRMGYAARQNQTLIDELDRLRVEVERLRGFIGRVARSEWGNAYQSCARDARALLTSTAPKTKDA